MGVNLTESAALIPTEGIQVNSRNHELKQTGIGLLLKFGSPNFNSIGIGRRVSIGRPLVLWVARRYGGMTLKDAGEAAGGMDYTAVAMSVKRLHLRAIRDKPLTLLMQRIGAECEK